MSLYLQAEKRKKPLFLSKIEKHYSEEKVNCCQCKVSFPVLILGLGPETVRLRPGASPV